jgi:excisionase family DNA binding protein
MSNQSSSDLAMFNQSSIPTEQLQCSTIEAAKLLGLAVRSVQLMVDRGDLKAWKTPGGHRRISRESVQAWLKSREIHPANQFFTKANDSTKTTKPAPKLLIIDTSIESRNKLDVFFKENFPSYQVHFSTDPVLGLTMVDVINPSAIIFSLPVKDVDLGSLIKTLQSKPDFANYPILALEEMYGSPSMSAELKSRNITMIARPHLRSQLETLFAQ